MTLHRPNKDLSASLDNLHGNWHSLNMQTIEAKIPNSPLSTYVSIYLIDQQLHWQEVSKGIHSTKLQTDVSCWEGYIQKLPSATFKHS